MMMYFVFVFLRRSCTCTHIGTCSLRGAPDEKGAGLAEGLVIVGNCYVISCAVGALDL